MNVRKNDLIKPDKRPDVKALHVISAVATPHNNILMRALADSGRCELHLYYSAITTGMYSWGEDVFHAVGNPVVVSNKKIYWPLVWRALKYHCDNYLFIGWPNNTARMLLVMFWLLRRPFLFWSDMPGEWCNNSQENQSYPPYISAFRHFLYYVVKTRARRIFLVGNQTVGIFKRKGYPADRLVNLPIFVRCDRKKSDYATHCERIRSKYNLKDKEMLFLSGSRLTGTKGFEDLIQAASIVRERVDRSFKIVIVGKGEQEAALRHQIAELQLTDVVVIENWMEPEEFESLIACSDVYVHPARFDAFGGGTLHAMALGVPVIGSDGAGVVVERVENIKNGMIFPAGNVAELAQCIAHFLEHPCVISSMGLCARETAEEWPPSRGAQIIIDALI